MRARNTLMPVEGHLVASVTYDLRLVALVSETRKP